MAVQGPFKVTFDELFPHGLGVVGLVMPVNDFDASTKEHKVQSRDKNTDQLVWSVDVMDFDPEARERTHKVKICAPHQPVPPEAIEGLPIRPVVLDDVTVTPYLKDVGNGRQRIAFSLRASGMRAPGKGSAAKSSGGNGSAGAGGSGAAGGVAA